MDDEPPHGCAGLIGATFGLALAFIILKELLPLIITLVVFSAVAFIVWVTYDGYRVRKNCPGCQEPRLPIALMHIPDPTLLCNKHYATLQRQTDAENRLDNGPGEP